jgi:hypothetical protein
MISSPASSGSSESTSSRCACAAVEQGGEQPPEMLVDRLERGEQPLAAFAVERADRAAQAVDRLGQLVALLGVAGKAASSSASSVSATRLTGPIRSRSAIRRSCAADSSCGSAHRVRLEAGLFRQQRRRAFEALARQAPHLDPAHLLILGARERTGARLARLGQRFVGGADFAFGRAQRRSASRSAAWAAADSARGLGRPLGLGDLRVELGRAPGEDRSLSSARFGGALVHLGAAPRGFAGARFPAAALGPGGGEALARLGDLALQRAALGAGTGDWRRGGSRLRTTASPPARAWRCRREARPWPLRRGRARRSLRPARRRSGRGALSRSARCDSSRSSCAAARSSARPASRPAFSA